jgi:hypothetical protein
MSKKMSKIMSKKMSKKCPKNVWKNVQKMSKKCPKNVPFLGQFGKDPSFHWLTLNLNFCAEEFIFSQIYSRWQWILIQTAALQ